MSARIVEIETINALVSWSVKRDLLDRMGVSGPDDLGQVLHNENVRSVNHRYNETTQPDTFKYSRGPGAEIDGKAILGVISSLDYQCCETDDWNSTHANACLAVMECDYISQVPHAEISLHRARHPMVVKALVAQGRDPNQSAYPSDCPYQNRPLHTARSPETARALIDAGAEVNGLNRIGQTPLHTLSEVAQPETVKALLENGADPMARDAIGNTPLHSTTRLGNYQVVGVLVKAGADPQAANNQGSTPISMAKKRGMPQTLAVLERAVIEAKAELDKAEMEAKTPFVSEPIRLKPRHVAEDQRQMQRDTTPIEIPDPNACTPWDDEDEGLVQAQTSTRRF